MVLKLNPGGWLGPFRRLGLLTERSVLNNFVEPLLLSVTTLRDKVVFADRPYVWLILTADRCPLNSALRNRCCGRKAKDMSTCAS